MTSSAEHISRVQPACTATGGRTVPEVPEGWFDAYARRLASRGLSRTGLQVLQKDTTYIVENCIYANGDPVASPELWPQSRLRRGLVLGAVQSGKTASMLGVAAQCFDRGIDIVIVLTGTRKALFAQTYERACEQLDGWSESEDFKRTARRTMIPPPSVMAGGGGANGLRDLYFETPNLVRRRLRRSVPLLAFVMKQADHLMCFRNWLHSTLSGAGGIERPLHLLVIDDEADDGSILDAVVEGGTAPDSENLKQIPRHIAHLWSAYGQSHMTWAPHLYATYLAYTATPQANFLQSDHNPLAPTDFIASLRTPGDRGAADGARESTYREPEGLRAYYVGGEIFYNRFAQSRERFVVDAPFPARDNYESDQAHITAVDAVRSSLLDDALRSYFVAVACSLYLSGKRISQCRGAEPGPRDAISAVTPSPLTALIHPSAQQLDHVAWARKVCAWSKGKQPEEVHDGDWPLDAQGNLLLDKTGLALRLNKEDEKWSGWLNRFEYTRQALATLPKGDVNAAIAITDWPAIRQLLLDEVFGNVRLAIVNAEPEADDRPHFDLQAVGDGLFLPPIDVFTIFIAGNVMSRGVTLDGLCTSVFLRPANQPAADTQMQMQRWFGYRGRILQWCRLFLFSDQKELFQAYHETDEALRREIIGQMNNAGDRAPAPTVLQGERFCATAKIANVRTLPLCPGASPFVRVVDYEQWADHNLAILGDLLESETWQAVTVRDVVRGSWISDRRLSLSDVADLLDRFRYSHHDPDVTLPENARWLSLQQAAHLSNALYRPPGWRRPGVDAVKAKACPYAIAAYLRLWAHALSRRMPGMYPTDDRQTPWSLIDLADYNRTAPTFNVGVRYGETGLAHSPRLAAMGVRTMRRQASEGVLFATWGSRNPSSEPGSYLGDEMFDYHVNGLSPPPHELGEPVWRPRGHPGLVLFHVLRDEATNRDTLTVGLALPLGGPDQFAALRPNGQRRIHPNNDI